MTKTKEVILVDGSSYFYRAFHALPPLTTSNGLPTGAIHGVLNMLRKLQNDKQPEHFVVVFDAKGKTFRDSLYKEYKANRPPMPDDLKAQIEPLKQAIGYLGIPLLCIEGVEADDVLGTLAVTAQNQGYNVLISTGDKDMAQLVNKKVTLVNTMTEQILDVDGVQQKFGVAPDLIIDYLALIGDKVDNVPGVQGCGPKTAVKWLEKFGSLAGVMQNASSITGKIGERLQEALAHLPLSRELVTIKTDVLIKQSLSDLVVAKPDKEKLIPLFKKLEMNSWLREMQNNNVSIQPEAKINYSTILSKDEFVSLIGKLKKVDVYVLDTETTSLNVVQAQLVGIAIALDKQAYYIPLQHDEDKDKQLDLSYVLAELQNILANPNKTIVGHNIKYDINILKNYDISIGNKIFDTMLASYILNSTNARHDLDSLALQQLERTTIKFEDVAGKGKDQKTFNQVPINTASDYAAEDAEITMLLYEIYSEKLQQENWAAKICQDIEFPLLEVLAKVERTGVLIDAKLLQQQSEELAIKISSLVDRAINIVGFDFNLSSPKQLQEILYDKLGIPVIKKTPKGQPSTAEAVLSELALEHELPKVILEYRQLSKLKSTYTDALPLQIEKSTYRVHTSYNQTVTSTGRLSSTEPNLQNIPIRREEGRRIREAFIAPKGKVIVSADYSQIELRVMAHLSKDKGLIEAFSNNLDVHSFTASDVFGVTIDKVDAEQRRRAKAINFGLIYGMSEFGLSKQLGISRFDAKKYIDVYFERYPDVHNYIEQTKKLAHEQGFVESIFGRRLYLPEIRSRNYQSKMAAERAAINAPVQGSAADIIKLAMLKVDNEISQSGVKAMMTMQVHDELVFEVAEKDLEELKILVKNSMESAATLRVSLEVDISHGANWNDAH